MNKSICMGVLVSLMGMTSSVWADEMPPKGHEPPPVPKEAIAACHDKPMHAACGFMTPNGHHFEGVCGKHPHQEFLTCGPKMDGHPPKPPKDGDVPPPPKDD